MKILSKIAPGKLLAVGILAIAAAGMAGCSGSSPKPTTAAKKALPPHPLITFTDPAKNQTGAQIWAENCMRCHQLRSPAQYNAAQWGVIVQYMRLKAGLTGEQARKVLAFLRSASSH